MPASRTGLLPTDPTPTASATRAARLAVFILRASAPDSTIPARSSSRKAYLTIPHRTDFDMSIYKIFKPTERIQMQFRAEGFNIFNHPQWSQLDNYVDTQGFLYATQAHMPRVLQFALRITF